MSVMSFMHIDRGSMHVEEHHDDLFSWKKYNNCTHMLALHKCRCKGVAKCGNILEYNVLILLAAELCCVTSRMSRESPFSTCFLRCCRVSNAALLGAKGWPG
jgi:hypothetical protein